MTWIWNRLRPSANETKHWNLDQMRRVTKHARIWSCKIFETVWAYRYRYRDFLAVGGRLVLARHHLARSRSPRSSRSSLNNEVGPSKSTAIPTTASQWALLWRDPQYARELCIPAQLLKFSRTVFKTD